ncbi:MAG: phosphatase PAP2 family protein [Bacilli bacterium]|nr:phosphatase PAP2 family protein [Bacilli bacterium]
MKKKKYYAISIIIVLLILIITIITTKLTINKELLIDKYAYELIVLKLRNDTLTPIMKFITKLSNTSIIILIAILLTIIISLRKNIKTASLIPINLGIIAIINQILKFIFQRPRPTGFRLIEIGGFSFPSGHAMGSTAFYGLLIYLSYKLIKNKTLKIISIILNSLIIIGIGISRIYLGVHYCSDVVVGISLTIIYLIIFIRTIEKKKIIQD